MRAARFAIIAALCGAALELCPLGCKKSPSTATGDDAGDDALDESASSESGSGGDDVSEPADALPDSTDDTVASNCTVPSGVYQVTATPSPDSGAGCSASTWTQGLPNSSYANDAGLLCSYTPNGSLPVCAISFSCGAATASESTTITGFISVDNTSFEGTEDVVVTSFADGGTDNCSYALTYVKQ
jgi:hypothetical protein